MSQRDTELKQREFSWRGFFLAFILTFLFTAANVYLGLKVGMTFATSIPAAVISMAILRNFKSNTILENNIVQTVVSSAGTISSVVFVLPGLVMLGYWKSFPFWQTFFLCGLGGILGVMFTIPLRRALVVESDLPYPEGRAAAETLKVGSHDQANQNIICAASSLKDITVGTVISFLYGLFSSGFKLLSDEFSYFGKIGHFCSGIGLQFSFALIGAGYLIGIRVAMALLIGTIISWVIAVPALSHFISQNGLPPSSYILSIWTEKVRYIGAGTIGIAAIWAIIMLLKPVYFGFKSSFRCMRQRKQGQVNSLPLQDQDIPIIWVLVVSVFLTLPLMAIFGSFISNYSVSYNAGFIISLVIFCTILVLLIGFVVSAVSGYMAGLVGSSNSPISGIGILAIIIVSIVLLFIFQQSHIEHNFHQLKFITGLSIFTTSIIYSSAAISNDNLQDLSTGHIIGATPWKQQLALIIGVVIGSIALAPVLNQLYSAYGFVGSPLPHQAMDSSLALSAPQATLMLAIVKGIVNHHMQWSMIEIGAVVGIGFLSLNTFFLDKKNLSISVLSIGIAIYLPPQINLTLILGGLLSYLTKRQVRLPHNIKNLSLIERRGTLISSGLIVGSSLFGILLALLITTTGEQSPLALLSKNFRYLANLLGTFIFIFIYLYLLKYIKKT